jgi:hypothetical protein
MQNPNESLDLETRLSRFYNSSDYQRLYTHISHSNLEFSQLPDKYKLASLYMLHADQLDQLADAWRLFYFRKPPTFEEFLTPAHGGSFAVDLYSGWQNAFRRDFSDGKQPNELIFTGSIGTGKTSTAAWLHVRNLIRVCLLINPQASLGVAFNTLLVLALFTVTLDKASTALIKPFTTLLQDSPYFAEVKKTDEFGDFGPGEAVPFMIRAGRVEFPRNIIINIGSTVTHAISYSMFGAMLDEAEFKGSVQESFDIYTNLKERIRSRFLGSRFTLLTLMSSARYSTGIIADYVKSVPKDDPHTKVYSFAIWDIKNFEAYQNQPWFKVLRGTTEHPHRILTVDEATQYERNLYTPPAGCEVIAVPEAYRADFTGSRISEALQNLAGIPVLFTASYPFTDLSRIEQPQLCPEVHIEVELGSTTPVIDRLPRQLFKTVFDELRFAVSPAASRIMSFDLAETAEAGVCCGHLSIDEHGRNCVVYDFILKVTSPSRIDIGLLRDLALDIARMCQLYMVTADQFQSTLFRQEIKLSGLVERVELVSVDRTVEPYSTVARLVQNTQVLTGTAPLLKKQLTNIQIDDKKSANKITGSREYRKDVSDSFVGVGYCLIMNSPSLTLGTVADWRKGAAPSREKLVAAQFQGMKAV